MTTLTLIANGSRPWHYAFGAWGLSFLIDDTILFDTFCDYLKLTKKMHCAGVNEEKITSIVISHAHYDHTGGLEGFLKTHKGLPVFVPNDAPDHLKHQIAQHGGVVCAVTDKVTLSNTVSIAPPMAGTYEKKSVVEQYLVLNTAKGLLIVTGCCHMGALEMVRKTKTDSGETVYGIIGGLHLMSSSVRNTKMIAQGLKDEGVAMIAPTHCTGWRAEQIFKSIFKDGFIALRERMRLSL